MAKADDTSSTIVWIWLREALALTIAAHGSVALAKERLTEWLAAGKVPWTCMSWRGLDAEGIAKLKREFSVGGSFVRSPAYIFPSAAYYSGDPQFWSAGLKIDWEGDGACELFVIDGAQALGIKVSRAHLLALLPEDPREHREARGAGAWIAQEASRMKAAGEISDGIKITDLARELERRMKAAAAVDRSFRAVKWGYIKNKLPEWGLWPVSSIQ
jgi:hypothetical protein